MRVLDSGQYVMRTPIEQIRREKRNTIGDPKEGERGEGNGVGFKKH